MAEGYELELTIRVKYTANPDVYDRVVDTGDDITAYELARQDAASFADDMGLLLDTIETGKVYITVAPLTEL